MSWITRALRRKTFDGAKPGAPEALWRRLIMQYAPGRSFLDVGCMWGVNGAYSFHAVDSGAADVVGLDVAEATPEFHAQNAETGGRVRFIQADLNRPDIAQHVGTADVVFCAGVLYHVPNPLVSLEQLRRLCHDTLILATASLPETDIPNVAVFLPFLAAEDRQRFSFFSRGRKIGIDTEFLVQAGYGNWFWLPTASCLEAMMRVSGWDVVEVHAFGSSRPLWLGLRSDVSCVNRSDAISRATGGYPSNDRAPVRT